MHYSIIFFKSVILLFAFIRLSLASESEANWQRITQILESKTYVVPSLWAEMPRLNAKTRVTILNVEGPGVVTLIHASALALKFDSQFSSEEAMNVILRIFYDGESKPAIEMPYMDFLGDIQCQSSYFNSVYFTKVKESHNFRIPIPFRKRIKIELENPSDKNLLGYTDIQWEKLPSIPPETGYLRVDYRQGNLNVQEDNILLDLHSKGKIIAHWFQYESEKSKGGETICEADQQLYLDKDSQPTLNYLGSEDVYGYSWGYKGTHSDGRSVILRQEDLKPEGSRIAILRCRTDDAISFQNSCKWVLTFSNDPGHQKKLGETRIPYRHCVYYYSVK